MRKQIQEKHACGMWGRAELVNACLTHDSSTWLTLARERQCDSCLTHCSSACLTSQRESPHTNLTFSPAFCVFGLAWTHMHTFVFAVMVAGLHVRLVLGVFVCGCVCTAASLRLCLPAVSIGGAYSKVKLFIFLWTGQSESQVLFDSCVLVQRSVILGKQTIQFIFFPETKVL